MLNLPRVKQKYKHNDEIYERYKIEPNGNFEDVKYIWKNIFHSI